MAESYNPEITAPIGEMMGMIIPMVYIIIICHVVYNVIQFSSTSNERDKERYRNAILWGMIGLVLTTFFIAWMMTEFSQLGMF